MSDTVDWKKAPGGVTVPDLAIPDMHLDSHRRWPHLKPTPATSTEPEQREFTFGLGDIVERVRNGYQPKTTSFVAQEEAREASRALDGHPTLPF